MAPGFPLSQSSETSNVSVAEQGKVRLRLYYEGNLVRDPDNNAWRYSSGESYLESIPVTCRYADFMHKLTEKFSRAVSVKYQIPGEDLDPENLITVVDDSDLLELYDEYFKGLQRPGTPVKTFRVKVFVFDALEEDFCPEDFHPMSSDFQDVEDVYMAQSPLGRWGPAAGPSMQCNEWHLESDEDGEFEDDCCLDNVPGCRQAPRAEQVDGSPAPRHLIQGVADMNVAGVNSSSLHLPSHISIFGEHSLSASGPCGLPSRISAFGDSLRQPPARTSSWGCPVSEPQAFGEVGDACGFDSDDSCAATDHVRTQPMSGEYPHLPTTLDADLVSDIPAPASEHPVNPEASNHGQLPEGSTADSSKNRVVGGRVQFNADPTVHRVTRTEVSITKKIGEGAYGEVSEARIPIFGVVAIKWLKPDKFLKHSSSFWQEAQMLHQLNHPNVLRLFGVITESGHDSTVVGIMTEFMRGGSLARWLRRHRSYLDLRRRCQVALQAVRGMAYLHERQVVHFDLKPDNLLIDGEGDDITVKVADFGLSRHKMRQYVSLCKELRGTLPYMAPELVASPDRVDEKADVWSMGVVMWEMLTLETPFQDVSPQSIIHGLMMGNLTLDIPGWCEPEWRGLLESCMEPVPSRRPSFKELARQLEAILEICHDLAS